ncbi:UNKNOWN [Stylonychia lemnae]|uniref:Kinetochore protein NDC80 n=1 Tax=Stylonychia lemnae TaxID=5949 RepID=A0A078B6M0_STYLE|nr:UNKNOWN [Stylonychia lemnae]|eukprot:CDW88927.1 UNKNOWN [Stylonychia lemnae]
MSQGKVKQYQLKIRGQTFELKPSEDFNYSAINQNDRMRNYLKAKYAANLIQIQDNNGIKNFKTINGLQAASIIYHLIKQFAPNYNVQPKFEENEILQIFNMLKYPGTIRSDAIKAVGAQTTIAFLIRALYWLYLVTKIYFIRKEPQIEDQEDDFIQEADNEDMSNYDSKRKSRKSLNEEDAEMGDEDELWYEPYEQIFLDILVETSAYSSYQTPHQTTYDLNNQVKLKLRPVIKLMMHEYQEYLYQNEEVEFHQIYEQVCSMVHQKINDQKYAIDDKLLKINAIQEQIQDAEGYIPNIDQLQKENEQIRLNIEEVKNQHKIKGLKINQKHDSIQKLKTLIEQEKLKQQEIQQEIQQINLIVKEQPITKHEADLIIRERDENQAQIQKAELSLKNLEELRRTTESQITQTDKEVANTAQTVNQVLVSLKLQEQGRMTEATPGKYSKGIHIKMLQNGQFDNSVDMIRDVAPIVEELKLKWRDKLDQYSEDKQRLNQVIVQVEIDKRNLEEEIKRIIAFNEHQNKNMAGVGISKASEKIRKDYENMKLKLNQLELENEDLKKQVLNGETEIKDLELEFQRIKEENEDESKKFYHEINELQQISNGLMADIKAFKRQIGGFCEGMKVDLKSYYDGLAQIFRQNEGQSQGIQQQNQ